MNQEPHADEKGPVAVKPAWEMRWYLACRAKGQRCKRCFDHRLMRSVVFSRFIDKPQLPLGLYQEAAIPAARSQLALIHKGHCSALASAALGPGTQFLGVLPQTVREGADLGRINYQGAEISHVYCRSAPITHSPLKKHSSQM